MSKQLTMWCVFNPNGEPLLVTLNNLKNKSIGEFVFWRVGFKWTGFRRKGYTCRKVRVTIEEIKT